MRIALGEREADTLHLPPATSVTFYSGAPPVGYLRARIAELLRHNPWLAGRLVEKGVLDGAAALRHPGDAAADVERHLTATPSDQARLTTDMDRLSLVDALGPLQAAS